MIRTHLIYVGDILERIMDTQPPFHDVPLTFSILDDREPSEKEGMDSTSKSSLETKTGIEIHTIQSYDLRAVTDGRRFAMGGSLQSKPTLLPKEAEWLIAQLGELPNPRLTWIEASATSFGKKLLKASLAAHDRKTQALLKNTYGRYREELTEVFSTRRQVLEALHDEGRVFVNVNMNTTSDGKVPVLHPTGIRNLFTDKRTVDLRNAKDKEGVIDHVAAVSKLFGGLVQKITEANGYDFDEDLFFHTQYPQGLHLGTPFIQIRKSEHSVFIFDYEGDKEPRYHSMDAWKRTQQGIVLKKTEKPQPVQLDVSTPAPAPPAGERPEKPLTPLHKQLKITKRDIKEALSAFVIGQDRAKDSLAAAAYKHYARIYQSEDDTEIAKSNLLLFGPTGCGKTLLNRSLAHILKVPFHIVDATAFTAPGIVGDTVETIIERLVERAGGDVAEAQHGIVYIDEIDKLASRGNHGSSVNTVDVQYGLLKLVEGNVIRTGYGPVDTRDILFVAGGAFAGDTRNGAPSLYQTVVDRLGAEKARSIGFTTAEPSPQEIDYHHLLHAATDQDFVAYGLIPELIGRFGTRAPIDPLSAEDFLRIATEPRDAPVKQAAKLFRQEGVELSFSDTALEYLAQKAFERGVGARGLKADIEQVTDGLLDLVGKEQRIVVDLPVVEQYLSN